MSSRISVRNPRTGEADYWIEPPSAGELGATAGRMRKAQLSWQEIGVEKRAGALVAWKQVLSDRRTELVDALIHDTGRRIESEMEIDAVLRSLDRWCGLATTLLAEERRSSSIPGIGIMQSMSPYPLVGVISPWNFPLLLSLIDTIPALVAGCAVMVKPSEVAPRFIEPLMGSIGDVPGLDEALTYIAGGGSTGSSLIDQVDLVCFTGSVQTGRRVAEQAARRFIPAFLELGGKDPAIVLASADLDRATSAILWGSTANAGQSCQSIERVYVDGALFEDFVGRLVAKAEKLRLAEPTAGDGEIGPIIAEKQIAVIQDHLQEAATRGARVHCGGQVEFIGGGAYCRPTVLTNVDHSMKVMTEETFGPIIPLMSYTGVDEAVRLANDTVYGLSAAVFAGSVEEALAVGRRVRAGGVSVNDAALTALVHDGEKNSFNLSGLGSSRMGPSALFRFGRRQAFIINEGTGPDPWWYPHLR